MSKNKSLNVDVIEISSYSTYDDEDDYDDSDDEDDYDDSDDDNEEEVRGPRAEVSPNSVVVKTEEEKLIDDDDCCILDFDPFETVAVDLEKRLSLVSNGDPKDKDDDIVTILAEKGEVACRDFPHSRHLCGEFLFDKTPHESHCPQCYCYVCDTTAPCTCWEGSLHSHCHASDKHLMWKDLRSFYRKQRVKLDS